MVRLLLWQRRLWSHEHCLDYRELAWWKDKPPTIECLHEQVCTRKEKIPMIVYQSNVNSWKQGQSPTGFLKHQYKGGSSVWF